MSGTIISDSNACNVTSDCGSCEIMLYKLVQMECLLDLCVCPSAFYHLALDIGDYYSAFNKIGLCYHLPFPLMVIAGIDSDQVPGIFSPIDSQTEVIGDLPTPLYCESNWGENIGVRLFSAASDTTGLAAVFFGLIVMTCRLKNSFVVLYFEFFSFNITLTTPGRLNSPFQYLFRCLL
jgi:hypothetical protein